MKTPGTEGARALVSTVPAPTVVLAVTVVVEVMVGTLEVLA